MIIIVILEQIIILLIITTNNIINLKITNPLMPNQANATDLNNNNLMNLMLWI